MNKQVALITGASRGLGAAFAESLAHTHHIVAVGRTTGALEALDDRIQAKGGKATLAPMDITQKEAMAHLCKSLFERWGSIDMWVHTAIHVAPLTPAATLDARDWEKSVAVNVMATGILIPFVAPLLKDTSTALFFDDPKAGKKFFSAYGASKAAQIALAYIWAAEHVRSGPKIHILEPNPMPTATRARFHPGEDKSKLTDPKIEALRLLNIVTQPESHANGGC
jgi:NAD(P)-dependent dehydrogenase (short-subunit alcohol dehydrogenase family)